MHSSNLKKRVLVAGGAGFLGSNLCRHLLDLGHQVICVDNLSTGRRENVAEFEGHPDFELIVHDITIPLACMVDEIYNLACPASPPKYQADPFTTIDVCVTGSRNLLDLATATGAPIVFTSTSEVYGDPEVPLQDEHYRGAVNCFGPRACYDEGKRLAETLHYEYRVRRGVDARVARLFNTYGPGMDPDDGRVVSNFVMQALRGEALTIYGDGSQTRSFCFVEDTIRGLVALMGTTVDVDFPVNIGNPTELEVREMAELVRAAVGNDVPIVFRARPVDDPMQRRPDISRAAELLGWRPEVELSEGLERTIGDFRAIAAAERLARGAVPEREESRRVGAAR